MNRKTILQTVGFLIILVFCANPTYGENIDPYDDGSQYAYGENVGWLNFEPGGDGSAYAVTVEDTRLTGYVWAENIGWINLSPSKYGGVINDGVGQLSGYAWGENVGWINFNPQVPGDPTHYGVTIDSEGNFGGWAWGENIGWIHFRFISMVDFEPFANFAVQWWQTGAGLQADLYEDGNVNWHDLKVFTDYWLDECPADWGICPPNYKVRTSWAAVP